MCLILFALGQHPDYPLVVAANRDEFHARPTAGVHRWQVPDGILAGRDLEAGGTWLGLSPDGRFAAVTNVSETPAAGDWLSRGDLVRDFLEGTRSATAFSKNLDGERYRGFHLLAWDGRDLVFSSNRDAAQRLEPGIYGLASAGLDEERFKLGRGRQALSSLLAHRKTEPDLLPDLFTLLSDRTLPDAGRPAAMSGDGWRHRLEACFIVDAVYGTRASSVALLGREQALLAERVFGPMGQPAGESVHRLPLAGSGRP